MHRLTRAVIIILLLLSIPACVSNADDENPWSAGSNSLEAGMGGVKGRITNLDDFWPGKNVYIFAAHFYGEIDGEGSFILEPSTFPKVQIEEDGSFQIVNLPPRNYVFIVGPTAEFGLLLGGKSPSSVVTVNPDEIIDLGERLITE